MARQQIEKEVEVETDTQSLQEQIAALQKQVATMAATSKAGGLNEDMLEKMLLRVAQLSADAYDRTQHPDNREHPGISVFSYPEGDLAKPRPELKCRMFWVGYELTTDTLTWQEIELLNRAEPGRFTFKRTDGTQDTVEIAGTVDEVGGVQRLQFKFLTSERRDTLPSMVAMLREAFHVKSPEQIELETLRATVERLKTQPVGAV